MNEICSTIVKEKNAMKQTLFYLACLLTVAALLAGCSVFSAPKPAPASTASTLSPTVKTAVVTNTLGPSPTATISTPSVVTVGAPATASSTPTRTLVPSKTPKPTSAPKYAPQVKTANFVKAINNPYFPLTPGTSSLFSGTNDTGKLIEQITVTKKTRKIMNVTCVEVERTLTVNDKLANTSINWYAQDKQGNVWFFGAAVKVYNPAGKVTSTAGTWLAGSNGAQPGIVMQAVPGANLTYRQDYFKGHVEDMAQVLSLTESVTGTSGSYTDVLEIKEWSALQPNLVVNKWYAKGVGLIMSKVVQGGTQELQLTEAKK
jgi:hypothetical protein